MFYSGFAGLLHLGFLDGLLMRWAENPDVWLHDELQPAFKFLGIEHALLLVPVAGLAIVFAPDRRFLGLMLAIAVYAILWNWACLGQYALQALKLFAPLSVFIVAGPVMLLIAILCLYPLRLLTLSTLVVACLLANLVTTLAQWRFLRRRVEGSGSGKLWETGLVHIRLGWSVLGANVLATLALSLDRVLLSATFSIRDFAIYSFAANALGLTYTMILSVARVVFPYLSQGISPEGLTRAYQAGESVVLLLWGAGMLTYFPVAWLIAHWLPNYQQSLPLIQVLMLATGLAASIHILRSPYFRIARKQDRFLLGAVFGLVSAAALLWAASGTGRLICFAWAMAASALAWWLLNEILLQGIVQQSVSRTVRGVACYRNWRAMYLRRMR